MVLPTGTNTSDVFKRHRPRKTGRTKITAANTSSTQKKNIKKVGQGLKKEGG